MLLQARGLWLEQVSDVVLINEVYCNLLDTFTFHDVNNSQLGEAQCTVVHLADLAED